MLLRFYASTLLRFYAGVIAVPAYPPNAATLASTSARVAGVLADAQASIILTDTPTLAFARDVLRSPPAGWLATDQLAAGVESEWKPPLLRGDSLATPRCSRAAVASPADRDARGGEHLRLECVLATTPAK